MRILLVIFGLLLVSGCAVLNIYPYVNVVEKSNSELLGKIPVTELSISKITKVEIGKKYTSEFNINSQSYNFTDGLSYFAVYNISESKPLLVTVKSYPVHRKDGPGLGNEFFFYPKLSLYDKNFSFIADIDTSYEYQLTLISGNYYGGNVIIPSKYTNAVYLLVHSDRRWSGSSIRYSLPTSSGIVPMSSRVNYEGKIQLEF